MPEGDLEACYLPGYCLLPPWLLLAKCLALAAHLLLTAFTLLISMKKARASYALYTLRYQVFVHLLIINKFNCMNKTGYSFRFISSDRSSLCYNTAISLHSRVFHKNNISKKIIVHTLTTPYRAYINHTQKIFFSRTSLKGPTS